MRISELSFDTTSTSNKPISAKQYLEIIDYFNKQLVMGAELERNVPVDVSTTRRALNCGSSTMGDLNALKKSPSNKYNVAYCYNDGTVQSGNEIVFAGTNESYAWIHKRLKLIDDKLDTLNSTSYVGDGSTHLSFLTIQDKVLPAILLKNIWNLSRVFSSALYWLTSGDPDSTFRRSGANHYAKARLSESPASISNSMFLGNSSKYSLCNLNKNRSIPTIRVGEQEKMAGLFVEFRQPDCIRVPSALTSLMFLHKALIYKAVDFSRKGCLLVESTDDWVANKNTSLSIANSHSFGSVQEQFCKDQSNRLIDFLEPELKQMAPESISILRKLAEKPVSKMAGSRPNRHRWHIEAEAKLNKKQVTRFSEREEKVIGELLDESITALNATKWKKKLSTRLSIPIRTIEYIIKNIETKNNVKASFDRDKKCYIIAKR